MYRLEDLRLPKTVMNGILQTEDDELDPDLLDEGNKIITEGSRLERHSQFKGGDGNTHLGASARTQTHTHILIYI